MKMITLLLITIMTGASVLVAANRALPASVTMHVQVKTAEVREAPSFLGPTVSHVSYGDNVEILEEKGAWVRVITQAGVQGWMHQSSLSRKKVPLSSGKVDEKLPVSSDELALASKGFGAEFEAELRKTRTDVDYVWVDRMEHFQVSQHELATFLKQGGLHHGAGGVP